MDNGAVLAGAIYGAVFIAVLLLVEGLYCLIFDHRLGSASRLQQRLSLHTGPAAADLARLRRRKAAQGTALLSKLPGFARLQAALVGAGCGVGAGRALGYSAGTAALVFILLLRCGLPPVMGAVGALLCTGAAPLIVIKRIARKRIDKFLAQLPDAIDMMVRSLRAGHPVAATIELVARETSDPVRSEFAHMHDEITYGLDLRDALDNMARRIAIRELHYMAVAIRLQISTGGNLAETLEVLSRVIRDRGKLKNKINALSAEGRLSAKVLSALPFVVAGVVQVISPKYYAGATEDPVILGGLCGAFAMICIGILIMHRMVNFRI